MADDDEPDEAAELERMFHIVPPPRERNGSNHDVTAERLYGIELIRLRAQGLTYAEIAARAGYPDRSGARQAVLRALDRHEAEGVAHLRTIENAAYDQDVEVCRSIIDNPENPADIRLRAIDTRTRLAARHARLNGLDAPQQIAVTSVTQVQLAQVMSDFQVVFGEVLDVTDTASG